MNIECDLGNVIAEVDVSEQWSVDENGKAEHFVGTSDGDYGAVGDRDQKGFWRYFCPICGMVTHDWNEVTKTHAKEQ